MCALYMKFDEWDKESERKTYISKRTSNDNRPKLMKTAMVDVDSSGQYGKIDKANKLEIVGGKVISPRTPNFKIPRKDYFNFESSSDDCRSHPPSDDGQGKKTLFTERRRKKYSGKGKSNTPAQVPTPKHRNDFDHASQNSKSSQIEPRAKVPRLSSGNKSTIKETSHKYGNKDKKLNHSTKKGIAGKQRSFKDLVNLYSENNENDGNIFGSSNSSDDESSIEILSPENRKTNSKDLNNSRSLPIKNTSKKDVKRITYDIFGSGSEESSEEDKLLGTRKKMEKATSPSLKTSFVIPKRKSEVKVNSTDQCAKTNNDIAKIDAYKERARKEVVNSRKSKVDSVYNVKSNANVEQLTHKIFGSTPECSSEEDKIEENKKRLGRHISARLQQENDQSVVKENSEQKSKALRTQDQHKKNFSRLRQKNTNLLEDKNDKSRSGMSNSSLSSKQGQDGDSSKTTSEMFGSFVEYFSDDSEPIFPTGTAPAKSESEVRGKTKTKQPPNSEKLKERNNSNDQVAWHLREPVKEKTVGIKTYSGSFDTREQKKSLRDAKRFELNEGLEKKKPEKETQPTVEASRPKVSLHPKEVEKIREILKEKEQIMKLRNTVSSSPVRKTENPKQISRFSSITSRFSTLNSVVHDDATSSGNISPFTDLVVARMMDKSLGGCQEGVSSTSAFSLISKNSSVKGEEILSQIKNLYNKPSKESDKPIRIVTVLNRDHYGSVLPKKTVDAIPEFIITSIL